MSARMALPALTVSALLAACAGSAQHQKTPQHAATFSPPATVASTAPASTAPAPPAPSPEALVTAETENRMLVVALPSGRVVRWIPLPADPQDISAGSDTVVVASAAAGKVTMLAGAPLRPVKTLGGFGAPHIVAVADDHAYVTDDARGTLTTIDLRTRRETSTVFVGAGAHHLSFDASRRIAWVALGESADTIVILSTEDPGRPRLIGRFDPGFRAHDLAFAPGGRQIWITSANGRDVAAFGVMSEKPLFRVPVGPPPQHVIFDGSHAYLTSGYGATIEKVDAASGRILTRAPAPFGSFELAGDSRYVVTSSLLRGTLAIYTAGLRLLRVVHLAPATREVAFSPPA